jgi:DNA-binding MarR family transcriptional regulator
MTQAAASEHPPQGELLGREFSTAIVMFHEAVGRLMGLSAVERKCIDVLRRLGPVTAGTIGEHTGLTTGAVTGLMDRLEKAGYVRRERDPRDRRKVVVQLLPNEHMDALLAAAFGPFGDDMGKIAARYSPAELRVTAAWIAATTEALVANTQRVMGLDQEESTVRSK